MVELIDLSGYVEDGQPVFPGNQRTRFWTSNTHEASAHAGKQRVGEETETISRKLKAKRQGDDKENPLVRTLLISEHGPTHVDAMSHLDPTSDQSIDELPLERFYGPGIGLDLSHVESEEFITVDDLEEGLSSAGLEIREGDSITLHIGHREENYGVEDHVKRHKYLYDYTGLSKDAAYWLGEQGVKNIGVDAPSIDHGSASETQKFPAHDMCAEYEVLNMENMANLDSVAGTRYKLIAFPLKLRGGTGSPIRPVAVVE